MSRVPTLSTASGARRLFERAFGLGPVSPPPHAFAIDGVPGSGPAHGAAADGAAGDGAAASPGRWRLRYAGFRREGQMLVPIETAEVDLPAEAIGSGLLGAPGREPARLEAAVAELVGSLDETVREASLVVPDAWLRVAFTDVAELPSGAQREEVLRWKLKRLVPFRVDELRLTSTEVAPLPLQPSEEPRRVLLGFGVDSLLAQLEDAFAAAGVRIGRITSASLALVAALRRSAAAAGSEAGVRPSAGGADLYADGPQLTAVVLVDGGGYTLAFVRDGEPVIHRHKGFAGSLPEEAQGGFVGRDLRLTRSFLDEQLPGAEVARAVVAAPPESVSRWIGWLDETLGTRAEPLGREHLPPMPALAPPPAWRELAPLVGAVTEEVR